MSSQRVVTKCQAANSKAILVLVVVLCCASLIDAAAMDHSKLVNGPHLYAHGRVQRSTDSMEDVNANRDCDNMACGWSVYDRESRIIQYHMRNFCRCQENYKCVRSGEILSSNAYQYRCRQNTSPNDIEFPINNSNENYFNGYMRELWN